MVKQAFCTMKHARNIRINSNLAFKGLDKHIRPWFAHHDGSLTLSYYMHELSYGTSTFCKTLLTLCTKHPLIVVYYFTTKLFRDRVEVVPCSSFIRHHSTCMSAVSWQPCWCTSIYSTQWMKSTFTIILLWSNVGSHPSIVNLDRQLSVL